MEPIISVIIPTYNRAHTIRRAINSVLNQTYKNMEIIVVDDASSDNTEEIVKSINDNRIIFIKHDSNKGGAAARNTGIKASKGNYVAFQDSDDEWYPEKLQLQTAVLFKAPLEVGVCYSSFIRINKDKRQVIPKGNSHKFEGYIFKKMLRDNFVTTQTALVKKKCFDRIGMFDESLPRLQDWELWLRISKYYDFIYLSKPLVVAHIQKDSISNSVQGLLEAISIIEKKHGEGILKHDPFSVANKYCWLGRLLIREDRSDEGTRYLLRAVNTDPFNIKFRLFYIGYKLYNRMGLFKNKTCAKVQY
jgi:glycosyltransferase involved in cell wall biosynthesis